MELLKIVGFFLLISHCLFSPFSHASASPVQLGKISFLIQQGQSIQAVKLYRDYYAEEEKHDFEAIHQIGLGLLDEGFRDSDPETQLLALFGASVSAHDEVYYILEESLRNPHPQIALVAIHAISRFQNNRSDQSLVRALGSDYLLIRLEAASQLCKKKHEEAISQVESLMYKTPKEFLPLYPKLYAIIDSPQATRLIRKMLNHSSAEVRVAAIMSIAQNKRDDLLPQIRQQASQIHYAQQEACAYALGVLKDDKAIGKLKSLTRSQYPTVALAAQQALYRLGQREVIEKIREGAKKGDLFAIAVLSEIPEETATLVDLLQSKDLNVRLNANLALLEHQHPACLPMLKEILIQDKRDLAFTEIVSPAGALKAWKAIGSGSQLLKEDPSAYETNLELKEKVLEMARNLPEKEFLKLAELVLKTHQHTIIPVTVELLEDLSTPAAIDLLIKYHQQPGAPLVRQYCNLALYRLKEAGSYGEKLRQWVQTQSHQHLIQFRPFSLEIRGKDYQLTPEETSRLLIGIFEAFTVNQDHEGIEALMEAIQNGHAKNRYALAGLLLRATQ